MKAQELLEQTEACRASRGYTQGSQLGLALLFPPPPLPHPQLGMEQGRGWGMACIEMDQAFG